MKGKEILVVFAHPEQKSFCGSLLNTVVKALTGLIFFYNENLF